MNKLLVSCRSWRQFMTIANYRENGNLAQIKIFFFFFRLSISYRLWSNWNHYKRKEMSDFNSDDPFFPRKMGSFPDEIENQGQTFDDMSNGLVEWWCSVVNTIFPENVSISRKAENHYVSFRSWRRWLSSSHWCKSSCSFYCSALRFIAFATITGGQYCAAATRFKPICAYLRPYLDRETTIPRWMHAKMHWRWYLFYFL